MNEKIKNLLNLYYECGPDITKKYKDEDDLFKIFLLLIKEKENTCNFEEDIRIENILLILKPLFSNKLQNIKYINKGIDLDNKNTIEYKESESRIYLLDEKDMDDIKNYQINPYSGRIIKKSFFNKYFPDINYYGYRIGNFCPEEIKKNAEYIEKCINNSKSFYDNYLYYRFDCKIIREMFNYRKCKTYKIYKGISFDDKYIDKIDNFFNLENSDEYIYENINLSYWSYDKYTAYKNSKQNMFGFVMSTIVNYDDILTDTSYLKKNQYFTYSDIILFPGKYKTKLSYVNNIKDNTSLSTFLELRQFLIGEGYTHNSLNILSNNFFLNIEKDLKSIHIYFGSKHPNVFYYKKTIHILNPYDTYKIDFKNPPDLLFFIKQNIKTIHLLEKLNDPSVIPNTDYYNYVYLDPYKYKKFSIETDSFEYPKILDGYYVKNIENIEIESKFDLHQYINQYLIELEKELNITHLFVIYLRYIDLLNENFKLLYYEDIEDIIKFINSKENIFLFDGNTNNLYKSLYDTHIKTLIEKSKEKLKII